MHGESACTLEPALVSGARKRLEKAEAVARSAVAKTVAFLVAVRSCLPDQLGAGEEQLFVEVVPRAGEDPGSARAPLQAADLSARRAGPVGEAVLSDRVPGENGRRLARERLVRLDAE